MMKHKKNCSSCRFQDENTESRDNRIGIMRRCKWVDKFTGKPADAWFGLNDICCEFVGRQGWKKYRGAFA